MYIDLIGRFMLCWWIKVVSVARPFHLFHVSQNEIWKQWRSCMLNFWNVNNKCFQEQCQLYFWEKENLENVPNKNMFTTMYYNSYHEFLFFYYYYLA